MCSVCMHVCVLHACLVPEEVKREHRIPLTRARDGCEQRYGGWELNLQSLEEHPVLLTTELSLQSCSYYIYWVLFISFMQRQDDIIIWLFYVSFRRLLLDKHGELSSVFSFWDEGLIYSRLPGTLYVENDLDIPTLLSLSPSARIIRVLTNMPGL